MSAVDGTTTTAAAATDALAKPRFNRNNTYKNKKTPDEPVYFRKVFGRTKCAARQQQNRPGVVGNKKYKK